MNPQTFLVESPFGPFRFHLLSVKESFQVMRVAGTIWGGPLPKVVEGSDADPAAIFVLDLAEMRVATSEVPEGWSWDAHLNSEMNDTSIDTLQTLREGYAAERAAFRASRTENVQTARA